MHYNEQGADFKYLITNERDKRFGLSITTVGFQAIKAGSNYPPRNHPDAYYFTAQKGRVLHEYQLVYITKGKGTFASDSTSPTEIMKGQILFLFPGQWHTYAPSDKTGWNEYYIGFEGQIIDNLVRNSFISKENQVLDIGINEELVTLFGRALEVAEADKTAAQQYLAGIVLHIMGTILSISQNKRYEIDNVARKIESAKIIMHENVYKDIDPEELATKLGISYSWFRKVFKEYTGYAPAKYFQELKLRKAKQLLIESGMSIKEICYELNYTSTEHFFAIFKKRTGSTPTEYRNFGRGTANKETNE
ncbi:helix-turn-helix domain-containing protein [Phocaeicola sp.]